MYNNITHWFTQHNHNRFGRFIFARHWEVVEKCQQQVEKTKAFLYMPYMRHSIFTASNTKRHDDVMMLEQCVVDLVKLSKTWFVYKCWYSILLSSKSIFSDSEGYTSETDQKRSCVHWKQFSLCQVSSSLSSFLFTSCCFLIGYGWFDVVDVAIPIHYQHH